MNKIWLIAQREFSVRVKKKSFLLTTILLPLLIFAFYGLMIYFSVQGADNFQVAVIDKAGLLKDSLGPADKEISFHFVQEDSSQVKEEVASGKYNGYLYIPAGFTANAQDTLEFRSSKTVGIMTQEAIRRRIDKALRTRRFLSMDITPAQLDSLQQESKLSFRPLSGANEVNKAGISYGVGFVSGFLIYIILFIYGTMVMRGVMEEKVSRIAEVIVSSAKPFQLMMGKITGIGAVGLVQFLIWIVLIIGIQALAPLFFPGLAGQDHTLPVQGGMQAAEQLKNSGALAEFKNNLNAINFPLILGCFIFYFLGGYLLYSSLFAAVGSAVNEDPQDAQSLLLPITMPIIFAIVIMTKAVNDPNSGLAVFGSLFPLTSPIVMMARVAHGVPEGVSAWQLLLSAVLLIGGFLFTTWMAGKIYRTGILMYGKKPTWKEMWKWAFRKN